MEIMISFFLISVGVYDLFHLKEYIGYFINKREREEVLFKVKDIKPKSKSQIFWSSNIGIIGTLVLIIIVLISAVVIFVTKGIGFNLGFLIFLIYSLLVKNVREATKVVRGGVICKTGISFGMIYTKWHRVKKIEKRLIRSGKTDKTISILKISYHHMFYPSFVVITGSDTDKIVAIISEINKKESYSIEM